MKKLHIEFDFKGQHCLSVIRVRQKAEGKEYHITVLNWELERLLYGNHVIKEVNGSMQVHVLWEKIDQTELKLIIASRLSNYLKIPCFASDLCMVSGPMQGSWEDWHPIPRHKHQVPKGFMNTQL